jgi:hypothetical protein
VHNLMRVKRTREKNRICRANDDFLCRQSAARGDMFCAFEPIFEHVGPIALIK